MKPSKFLAKKHAASGDGGSSAPRSLWNEFNENIPQLFPWTAPWMGQSPSWPAAAAFKAPAKHKDGVLTVIIPKIKGKDNHTRINIE